MSTKFDWSSIESNSAKALLEGFIERFNDPAFGSLPKREIELAVFELMRDLGLISKTASLYQLMTDLRITRTKASQLLFDIEVRKHGGNEPRLDEKIKDALLQTKFAKDGDYFVLEIENPLVIAHLRNRIRELGHISDTSFNSALVRMPLSAATDLMLKMIPNEEHQKIREALVKAGAPDSSVKGVVKASLKTLGSKIIGEAADSLAEDIVENAEGYLKPLLEASTTGISKAWKNVWPKNQSSDDTVEV